jgi:hypothetical protein
MIGDDERFGPDARDIFGERTGRGGDFNGLRRG